jgi:NRAMP (natural resistance-associated macrophage protein)-like metal ion transporter
MKSGATGLIIAAAFIGPGTVTTASIAGASLGYGLVWALCFSIFATFILQEMASRLGLVTRQGLSEAIVSISPNKFLKWSSIILVCAAIGLGNAAYEGGNLTGAAMGLANVMPGSLSVWALILGGLAFALLLSNRYHLVEKVLIGLVALMSIVFISIMFIAGINTTALMNGLTQIGLSDTSLLLAIIGTTIVPYNLFLHAGLSAKQSIDTDLSESDIASQLPSHKKQLFSSIGLGGLVTFAVMSCAANAFYLSDNVLSPGNIASQLEPILGDYANLFFALGLFSAGLTSAITAPLAAGYAICGLFGWQANLASKGFKSVCIIILVCGVLVATSGFKPLAIIVVAQASNALLLPISVLFLLYVMNQKAIMKSHTNTAISNSLAGVILLVIIVLGANKLFGLLF